MFAAARLDAWALVTNARLSASELDAIRQHARPRVLGVYRGIVEGCRRSRRASASSRAESRVARGMGTRWNRVARAGRSRFRPSVRGADLHHGHDRCAERRDAVASQFAVHRGGVEHVASRGAERRGLRRAAHFACVRAGVGLSRQLVRGRDAQARAALRAGRRAARARARERVDLPGRPRDAREAPRTLCRRAASRGTRPRCALRIRADRRSMPR